ncbi:effector-associated constant component EACC1 [Streptomyces nanshensis]|uniref:Uncharacterized protein n=1 Tax=Streptomyces nanshensis TaxID=518642 RepID=A0A1E7L266_9ACTN|nr:hypothetical protein [Streptomyces nanshensis]OEV10252.1 hypothetical protein AN218_18465 [Streptomyces nanshensis]
MRIALRLKDAEEDGLDALEDWLRSEHDLRRVVVEREHTPTAPGEMGVLADSLQFVVDAGLVGVLAQSLIDYWRSRAAARSGTGDSANGEDPAVLRIEQVDAPGGTRTITVEARDLATAEAVLRELPRTLGRE